MIQINQVIDYLRSKLPTNIRIDGAAALANAKDDSRLMVEGGNILTTLFVIYEGKQVTETVHETYLQKYTLQFSIIVCLDNQQDRTGKSAQQKLFLFEKMLFSSLLNYGTDEQASFDPDSHAVVFVADKMLEMDRARYWHKYTFSIDGRLMEEDGVSINLSNFNEYVANWNSSDPLADNPLATDDIKPLYDIPS